MKKLNAEQILKAKAEGKLDWLLKLEPPPGQLSRGEMDELSPAELAHKRSVGFCDWTEGRRERWV